MGGELMLLFALAMLAGVCLAIALWGWDEDRALSHHEHWRF